MSTRRHNKNFTDIYKTLRRHYGHQKWWPGETPFEVIIGAILTQNTAWSNVEKAIGNLKKESVLTPLEMRKMKRSKLASLIRPSGYYNIKVKRIKAFLDFLFTNFDGKLARMFSEKTDILRNMLLGVNGIGPETADSILLYAGNKPVFVVDAYTRRIFSRLDFLAGNESYQVIQEMFAKNIPRDVNLYNDFHAQIVILGKTLCRKKPKCELCPIKNNSCGKYFRKSP